MRERSSRPGRIFDIDRERRLVTAGGAVTGRRLAEALATRGLGLPQVAGGATLAEAVERAAHVSAPAMGVLGTYVRALELRRPDGSYLTASATEHPELFDAARAGPRLAELVTVTVEATPARSYHVTRHDEPWLDVRAALGRYLAANEQLTLHRRGPRPVVTVARANPTDRPAYGRGLVQARLRYRPRRDEVNRYGLRVPRGDLEYALAIDQLDAALESVPGDVAVSFAAGDDLPRSPASGRDTAYVAVATWSAQVEERLWALGGRPQWGTRHTRTDAQLASRYPRWDYTSGQG